MRLESLCTDTVKDHGFLDAPVHVHMHVVTKHECKIIMMVLIMCIRQSMVLPRDLCIKCCSHEIFQQLAYEYLNWENFC